MLRKRTVQENNDDNDDKNDKQIAAAIQSQTRKSNIFLKVLLLVFFILYIFIPFFIYSCPAVRRHAVFLNYVSLSRQKNLSVPEESGLSCTRNFYISFPYTLLLGNIKLGAWHVPPISMLPKCTNGLLSFKEAFKGQHPVFLYLHGNAGTRSGGHRVSLYKVLSEKLDSHVIAIDYRGFGDSSNVSPTEEGLVEDARNTYLWLLYQGVEPSRIFIWGHSLGTGVGVAFLYKLSTQSPPTFFSQIPLPAGLILEAPFTKIIDAAKHHPLSIFHRYMPFFEDLIAKPIGDKDTGFDSISRIGKIRVPILILHAEDDGFVPFSQGKELYDAALQKREYLKPSQIKFVGFDGKLDLGHKDIYKNPELPNEIKKFITEIKS